MPRRTMPDQAAAERDRTHPPRSGLVETLARGSGSDCARALIDDRPAAVAGGIPAGPEAVSPRLPESDDAEPGVVSVLAAGEVRVEANRPHQPRRHQPGAGPRRRRIENAVREPLFLDRARGAGAAGGPGA